MDLELDGQTISQLALIDQMMGLRLNTISESPKSSVNKSLASGFQKTEKLIRLDSSPRIESRSGFATTLPTPYFLTAFSQRSLLA
jgi:hypothetical protein